jgi:glycosyltransferase involved in cell wall biosynthesis
VAPVVTHGGGGLPRQVELQTRALDDAGHRVFLVQRPDDRFGTDDALRARWGHLTRWEVGPRALTGRGARWRERALGARFTLRALIRLLRGRRRYDVIHAHQLYSPTLIGAVVKSLTGTPLVVRVTAAGEGVGEVDELARLPFARLRRWALGKIDVVVAQTEFAREELIGAGIAPERVRIVPSVVELPAEPLPQPRIGDGPYRLLYAGRFSEEKGLDTAVEALALLRDAGRDVRLRLVGRPDPDRDATPRLRERARALSVEDRIEWADFTDAISDEHAAADAFVLPSHSEGMSNALLEAAAAGMVCIASDIPQNRAVTGDDGARYFAPGDARALADLVADLDADRERGGAGSRALASAARGRVAAAHTPERVAARLAEIYAEVTADA